MGGFFFFGFLGFFCFQFCDVAKLAIIQDLAKFGYRSYMKVI
jgi:phosphatidylglycerophosphatase A